MKTIGNEDFNIMSFYTTYGYLLRLKANPFEIYYEYNNEKYDKRIQFGIGLFNYRIGITLEDIN
tara:strand:- start:470 stop:661 length:192 start_codon:yes stop_codon:yes gene_type:complete